jgi:rhamnulokinase
LSDTPLHLAIDLGAGSGRAILGRVSASDLLLQEVHRFQYAPRQIAGHLRWHFEALLDGLRQGIRRAAAAASSLGGRIESMGVDSWGVDYGLLNEAGCLLEDPVCYRDNRTADLVDDVCGHVSREEIFSRTGIQFLPLNTLYQLVAHVREGLPAATANLLLVPDLCHHALCRSRVSERTNASTTQLLRVDDGRWDSLIFERLGLPLHIMPDVVPAGTELGSLLPEHQRELSVGPLRVIAPATHDTASAVAGTPLTPAWAYISSGTWSLVGVERDAPLVNGIVARANFTNEAGACGTICFLKNVMGLWILEACRREWEAAGVRHDLSTLLEKVDAVDGIAGVVFPDHPRFFNPSCMITELRGHLMETKQPSPDDPVLLTKIILDSLAFRYASVIGTIEALTGRHIPGIHIVGGGALNRYLNQATANATGRPVLAGPAEATATGNLVVQAIACGEVSSLADARRIIERAARPQRFTPQPTAEWMAAARRYQDIEGQCAA